jgi:hypothetical protein
MQATMKPDFCAHDLEGNASHLVDDRLHNAVQRLGVGLCKASIIMCEDSRLPENCMAQLVVASNTNS